MTELGAGLTSHEAELVQADRQVREIVARLRALLGAAVAADYRAAATLPQPDPSHKDRAWRPLS